MWFRKILIPYGMEVGTESCHGGGLGGGVEQGSRGGGGGGVCGVCFGGGGGVVCLFLFPTKTCFKCTCLHTERIFSYYMAIERGQICVPYFTWRGLDRFPHYLFFMLFYSSKPKMIPVLNLIGMGH